MKQAKLTRHDRSKLAAFQRLRDAIVLRITTSPDTRGALREGIAELSRALARTATAAVLMDVFKPVLDRVRARRRKRRARYRRGKLGVRPRKRNKS